MAKATKKHPGPPKSVGMTMDGIRVLKPKTTATEFTTEEIRSTIEKVRRDMGIEARADRETLFIERRDNGHYAVRRPDHFRAIGVFPTQRQAIERARELVPDRKPIVERVRHSSMSEPDRWRKE